MSIEKIYAMAIEGKHEDVLLELEKQPPTVMKHFFAEFVKDKKDLFVDFYDKLTDEQQEKFKWLESSERMQKYLMTVSDDDISDELWNESKACDF